jgi:hypothetical protein
MKNAKCRMKREPKEAFPPGSLLEYFTPERDKEELAILIRLGHVTLARRRAIRETVRDMLRLSATD